MARHYRVVARTPTATVFDRVITANTRTAAVQYAWAAYRIKGGKVKRADAETQVSKAEPPRA